MKSIKQWVQELPEPIKSRALFYEAYNWHVEMENLAPAIGGAFVWVHSKEGHLYWQLVSMGDFEQAEEILKEANS
jgi:hypothetical protein